MSSLSDYELVRSQALKAVVLYFALYYFHFELILLLRELYAIELV